MSDTIFLADETGDLWAITSCTEDGAHVYLLPDGDAEFYPWQEILSQFEYVDEPQTMFESELTVCPDCDASIELREPIESAGSGTAFGYVECRECGFAAREEWQHLQTLRISDLSGADVPPNPEEVSPDADD